MDNLRFQTRIEPVNEEEKSAKAWLEGEIVLSQSNSLQRVLQETLQEYNVLHLHLSNIVNLDLAGIQLIIATKKAAEATGKKLTLTASLPDAVKHIVFNAGFATQLGENNY